MEGFFEYGYYGADGGAELCIQPLEPCPRSDRPTFGEPQQVSYGEDPAQVMELYVPTGEYEGGALPAFVWIAGDAWSVEGQSATIPPRVMALQESGVIVGVVRYRGRDTQAPTTISDVRQAIRWLHEHGPSLYIDPNRIAAGGFAGGGHLAALLAVASSAHYFDLVESETTPHITFAATFAAPLDLDLVASPPPYEGCEEPAEPCLNCSGSPLTDLLDCTGDLADCPDAARLWSPRQYAYNSGAALLMVHGRDDCVVHPDHAARMQSSQGESRPFAHVAMVPGAGHDLDQLWTNDVIEEFQAKTERYLIGCAP